MKFPASYTCGFAILESIYKSGPMTQADIVQDFKLRFARYTMTEKLAELLEKGMLIETVGKVTISLQVRRHFDQCEIDESPIVAPTIATSVAGPRVPPPFKPMTGYKLNTDGMRDGAAEHRNWKSRHLPE